MPRALHAAKPAPGSLDFGRHGWISPAIEIAIREPHIPGAMFSKGYPWNCQALLCLFQRQFVLYFYAQMISPLD